MGLLSFIKGVGEKVLNKNETVEITHPETAEPLRASALIAHAFQSRSDLSWPGTAHPKIIKCYEFKQPHFTNVVV
jgi:hypothetical protein